MNLALNLSLPSFLSSRGAGAGGGASIPIDILLVIGQSNAVGFQTDQTTSYVTDTNVMSWDQAAGIFKTYVPGTYTGMDTKVADTHWAAELTYAQNYRTAYPTKKLAIVKVPAQGTQLATGGGQDWAVTSTNELYDYAAASMVAAKAALVSAGYTPTLRIVYWNQGESDASDPTRAANYQTNLAALIAGVRDANGSFKLGATAKFAMSRLQTGGTDVNTVRAAQEAIIQADTGGPQVLIDQDGLTKEVDGVHFTKASQITLGNSLWAADQAVQDATPTQFTFTDATNVAPSAVSTSAAITVLGVDALTNVPISITGGTYAINGGSYVSTAGNVKLNDTVTVRVTASASISTTVSAVLTIGGISDSYDVTTAASAITATSIATALEFGPTAANVPITTTTGVAIGESVVLMGTSSATPSAVSDTVGGNTWVVAARNDGGSATAWICYCLNIATAIPSGTVVSVTVASSSRRSISATKLSTPVTLDTSNNPRASTTTTAVRTLAPTGTPVTGSVLFISSLEANTGIDYTEGAPTSPWTSVFYTTVPATGITRKTHNLRIVDNATGSNTITFTPSATSTWAGMVVSFKQ
jgi:hypothetical protein